MFCIGRLSRDLSRTGPYRTGCRPGRQEALPPRGQVDLCLRQNGAFVKGVGGIQIGKWAPANSRALAKARNASMAIRSDF